MSRPAALALALLVLTAAAAACGEPDAPPAVAEKATGERLTLRVAEIADYKPVAAIITTRDLAEARARIGGVLVRLDVREGDTVARGQRIGLVADDRLALDTAVFAARAEALAAEAERARRDLERTRTLVEKGVYAPSRLDQDQAAADAARKQTEAAQAQRAASAEIAGQGAILAPSAGRVLTADTPAGSVVMPGQSLATITAGPLVVRLEVPEAQAASLVAGAEVRVRLSAGAETSGRIAQIYPDVTGGMIRADVAVAGLDAGYIGRRVEVQVPVGRRAALVIPARFVSTRYGVDFVRVLGADGAAGDAPVQLAPGPDGGSREVLSGLAEGDVILAPGR